MSLAREILEKIVKEEGKKGEPEPLPLESPIEPGKPPCVDSVREGKPELEITAPILIEQTLLEINQAYPEVRDRVKDSPQWKTLSEIEREINRATLEDDFEELGKALEAYKRGVLTVEDTESQGNLFGGLSIERCPDYSKGTSETL